MKFSSWAYFAFLHKEMVLAGCAAQGQYRRPPLLAHSRHVDAFLFWIHTWIVTPEKKPKTPVSQATPDGWIPGCRAQLPHAMVVMGSSWACSAWRRNPAAACQWLQVRAKLFTAVHEGKMRHKSWDELKWEVWIGYKENLTLWRWSSNGPACPERLCHLCPWRFWRPSWVEPRATTPHLRADPALGRRLE